MDNRPKEQRSAVQKGSDSDPAQVSKPQTPRGGYDLNLAAGPSEAPAVRLSGRPGTRTVFAVGMALWMICALGSCEPQPSGQQAWTSEVSAEVPPPGPGPDDKWPKVWLSPCFSDIPRFPEDDKLEKIAEGVGRLVVQIPAKTPKDGDKATVLGQMPCDAKAKAKAAPRRCDNKNSPSHGKVGCVKLDKPPGWSDAWCDGCGVIIPGLKLCIDSDFHWHLCP